jgi:hypothetical protein
MNYKVDWWDNFNEELYSNYLIENNKYMNTYKITYKYYKGNNEEAEMCVAIKYVQADDKQEAKKVFGMWEKLILKIERI